MILSTLHSFSHIVAVISCVYVEIEEIISELLSSTRYTNDTKNSTIIQRESLYVCHYAENIESNFNVI